LLFARAKRAALALALAPSTSTVDRVEGLETTVDDSRALRGRSALRGGRSASAQRGRDERELKLKLSSEQQKKNLL
jgi:hypothetical protein